MRYAYDPARAKALLAEAGFPDGFETELVTYVLPQWAAAVQGYLARGRHPRARQPAPDCGGDPARLARREPALPRRLGQLLDQRRLGHPAQHVRRRERRLRPRPGGAASGRRGRRHERRAGPPAAPMAPRSGGSPSRPTGCRCTPTSPPTPSAGSWTSSPGRTSSRASMRRAGAEPERRRRPRAPPDRADGTRRSRRPAVGQARGASTGQRPNACGQRGWKRQPVGMSAGSGSASPRPTSGTPRPGSGVSTEASSARV